MSRIFFRFLCHTAKRNRLNVTLISLNAKNEPGIIRCYSSGNKPKRDQEITPYEGFVGIQTKNKKSYIEMIDIFMKRDRLRLGHVEFIYSALKHMKDFGVEKDLEVYKKLIDVFPKGKMIPRNIFQAEFMHYPKHQQCAIDLLEQMEENGVMPDWEMQDQLLNVFGSRGYPLRRYWRMMYWMPRFKKASPWPLPEEVPSDTLELAKLAITRITDVDPTTEVTVHHTKDIEASLEDTWIVSGQSEVQRELITSIPDDHTLYVDGGLRVWLRNKAVTYFMLSTDPFKKYKEEDESSFDDVSNIFQRRLAVTKKSVHEMDENIILAVGSSGTSSADSMLSWVRVLSASSPRIADLRVLFRLPQKASDGLPPEIAPPQEKLDSV